jgi:glycosyltransferase involved in cell wall biosynthesis
LEAPALSIVIPAYNEEATLPGSLEQLSGYLETCSFPWEIVVVDDGSRDGTAAVVHALAVKNSRIRLIPGARLGKGAAIRQGMLAALGTWRFMADADLSMPVGNLARFLQVAQGPTPPALVIGSREAPGAIRRGEPWTRHFIGRAFNWLVQLLLLPGIRDTQCGFKLLRADAVAALFPHLTEEGFAFDVELLFLARRARFRIQEIGIVWNCRVDSRVGVGRGAAAFGSLVRIRLRDWRGGYRNVQRTYAGEPSSIGNAPC